MTFIVRDEPTEGIVRLTLDRPQQRNALSWALARAMVARFYGEPAADAAEAHFDRLFREKGVPDEMDEVAIAPYVDDGSVHVPALAADAFSMSRSDVRRMISQGGVSVGDRTLAADELDVPAEELAGRVLKAGKRRFARLT